MSFDSVIKAFETEMRKMGFTRLVGTVNENMMREYLYEESVYVGVSAEPLTSAWTWNGMILNVWVKVSKHADYNDMVVLLSEMGKRLNGTVPHLTVSDDLEKCSGSYEKGTRGMDMSFLMLFVSARGK